MKHILPMAAALVALGSFAGTAKAQFGGPIANRCFASWSGTTQAPYNQGWCDGYLSATYNALHSVKKACPNGGGPSLPQLKLITAKWMVNHAEQLNRPVPDMLRNALIDAFPCGRK